MSAAHRPVLGEIYSEQLGLLEDTSSDEGIYAESTLMDQGSGWQQEQSTDGDYYEYVELSREARATR